MVYCYEEIRMVHYDHVKGGNSKCSSIYKTKRQYGYKIGSILKKYIFPTKYFLSVTFICDLEANSQ